MSHSCFVSNTESRDDTGREKVTDAGRQTETAARKHLRKIKDLRGEIRAGREDVIEREGNEKAMTRRENGLVKEESRKMKDLHESRWRVEI